MADLVRFGVSIDKTVLDRFDAHIQEKAYPTRSKAIQDLIQEELVRGEWQAGQEAAGTITLVFDHHKRDLVNRITDIQHDFHHIIISSQHIHLDHDHCLEVVIVRGRPETIHQLSDQLKTVKGMILASLNLAATAGALPG